MKVQITWFHELLSKYFVKDYLRKQNSLFNSVQTPWRLNFLQMFVSGMWKIATFDIFQVLFCTFHSSKNMAQTTRENAQGQNLWKDSVFLPKQEHFWSFHTFFKIRKEEKTLQTDPHKILRGFFLSFSIVSPHHKRNGTRLLSPQFEYIQKTEKKIETKQKAFQLTRTFMCYMLNLTDCVKQASKTFETAHIWVHSLAHDAFSSPKANKRIETFYKFKKTRQNLILILMDE